MELKQTFIHTAIDALEMEAHGLTAAAETIPGMEKGLAERASELLDVKGKLEKRSKQFTPSERWLIEGALKFSIGVYTRTTDHYAKNGDLVNHRRDLKKKRAAQDALEDLQHYKLFTK